MDGRKYNSNQKWNKNKVDMSVKIRKKITWNPDKCTCENGKYLTSIIDKSVLCYETIETTKSIVTKIAPAKSIPRNINEKRNL